MKTNDPLFFLEWGRKTGDPKAEIPVQVAAPAAECFKEIREDILQFICTQTANAIMELFNFCLQMHNEGLDKEIGLSKSKLYLNARANFTEDEWDRWKGLCFSMSFRDAWLTLFSELGPKVDESLTELVEEVKAKTLTKNDNTFYQLKTEPKDILKALADKQSGRRRQRLGIGGSLRGGSKSEFRLTNLWFFYRALYPAWKDAADLYRKTNDRKDWPKLVKAACPGLPNDLILRLDDPANLPEEIQEKLAEKGGDPTPSSIALEHSARFCGVPDYYYTERYLQECRSEQEAAAKKTGELQ